MVMPGKRQYLGFNAQSLKSFGLLVLLSVSVAGCSSIQGPPEAFDLATVSGVRARTIGSQFNVGMPIAVMPYANNRIVIRTGDGAVAYLSDAQWVDQLPVLIQTRLMQSYENAHLQQRIGQPGGVADHTLAIEIRRFDIDVHSDHAVVELSARWIANSSGRIVAARIFHAEAPAPKQGSSAMVAALNNAATDVFTQIIDWSAHPK